MKKSLIVSALGLALFASAAKAQPLYTAINPDNGHTYYLLPQNTWVSSEMEAVILGGHLATVRSAAEEDWIYSTFSSYGGISRNLFIGLTSGGADGSVPGNFYWVSGDSSTYRNWFGPEPSDSIEHFTEIIGPGLYGSGGWNNIPCHSMDIPERRHCHAAAWWRWFRSRRFRILPSPDSAPVCFAAAGAKAYAAPTRACS